MHILGATRIRIVILLIFVVIVWQVCRNWPTYYEKHDERITRPSGAPVLVMVFYEALCPDSKHFIIKQLQSAFYKAPALIEYQLVPYGKATTSIEKDGSLSFDCQHGPIECEANTYHACVIEAIDEPKVLIDVVACMIKDNMVPKEAMRQCCKRNRIDPEPIEKCYDSPHGAELLKLHGEATSALRPTVSFIPTITLDGSQQKQTKILKDLLKEVCAVASGRGPQPEVCNDQ